MTFTNKKNWRLSGFHCTETDPIRLVVLWSSGPLGGTSNWAPFGKNIIAHRVNIGSVHVWPIFTYTYHRSQKACLGKCSTILKDPMGNVAPNNVKLTKPGQVTVHRQAQKLFDTIKSCFELRKFTKYIYIWYTHQTQQRTIQFHRKCWLDI